MTGFVQALANAGDTVAGFNMRYPNEGTQNLVLQIASSQFPVATHQPLLTIEYEVPITATDLAPLACDGRHWLSAGSHPNLELFVLEPTIDSLSGEITGYVVDGPFGAYSTSHPSPDLGGTDPPRYLPLNSIGFDFRKAQGGGYIYGMDPLPTASTTSQSQTFANREVFRFGLSPAGPPDSPFLDYEDMGAPLTVPGVDFGYRYFAGEVVPTSILGAAASVSPSPTLYAVGPNHHTGAATAEIVLLEIDGATPAAIAEYDLVYDSVATDENGLAFTGEPDFADFAYNPLDGNLYGYDTRTKRFAIIRFDDVNEVFEVFPFDA